MQTHPHAHVRTDWRDWMTASNQQCPHYLVASTQASCLSTASSTLVLRCQYHISVCLLHHLTQCCQWACPTVGSWHHRTRHPSEMMPGNDLLHHKMSHNRFVSGSCRCATAAWYVSVWVFLSKNQNLSCAESRKASICRLFFLLHLIFFKPVFI